MLQWRRWLGADRATGGLEQVCRLEQRARKAYASVQIWKNRCRCICKVFALVVDCLNSSQDEGDLEQELRNESAVGELVATMQRGVEILESCSNFVGSFSTEEDFRELLYSLQDWVPLVRFSTTCKRVRVLGLQFVADTGFLHRELEQATEQDREMIRSKSRKLLRILLWEMRRDFQGETPEFLLIPEETLSFRKPIGSGSYGAVYEAAWQRCTVAVKKFVRGANSSSNRELAALMRLAHPNVVRMFGISYDHSSHLYSIVMERMTMDLQTFIEQNEVNFPTSVSMLLEVAKGMRYLHSCNVIHRDLKPGNLLLRYKSCSSTMWVKISDFGTSRTNYQTGDATPNVGSKCFRAPEVMGDPESGNIPYSKKADVYSFAMLCYYVLTRRMPFENIMRRRDFTQLVRIEGNRPELPDSCPEALHSLIKRCWSANVEQRPSFEEICDLLKELKACTLQQLTPDDFKYDEKLKRLLLRCKRFSCQNLASKDMSSPRGYSLMGGVYHEELLRGERVSIVVLNDYIMSLQDEIGKLTGDAYASLEHRNILKLYGILKDKQQNWIAVTEFIGRERKLLQNSLNNFELLTWSRKLEIALDCATGLEYLHSHGIIHRGICPENIYLGFDLVAQIAWRDTCTVDLPFDHPIDGIPGYVDLMTDDLTPSLDVYSFGVVLLDLLTGTTWQDRRRMKPHSTPIPDSLVLDPHLTAFHILEIELFKELALKCLRVPSSDRPTMKQVVAELSDLCSRWMMLTEGTF